ncbi:DNA mismatch repair protein MutL [Dentipellis sp. KUC8613]|nr:DNA mismatch repair protein MutL [Dentipellis sp. KUC8613]
MSQEETRENAIKAIDAQSIHRITSGQVVSDLQTAVKELVENSLDAGAKTIEIRFKDFGLKSIEVIDNGSGIAPEDYDSVGLKHHTSKLASFEDLTKVLSFGFRGEALSSLCALTESVIITTSMQSQAPIGTILELDRNGRVKSRDKKVARQRGTTVAVHGLFKPLPVRRKELERNAKREFTKALNLLNAYALVPCTKENQGVRLTVSNQSDSGRKTVQLQTDGSTSLRSSVTSLWGPKSLENIVELNLEFDVETEKTVLRRRGLDRDSASNNTVRVRGLISKFVVGCGRTGSDRQFFYINGRPCTPTKVQKAFNEVYKTFNMNQLPFIVADFIIPTDSCDINVSPDKRTILLHSENNLIDALKKSLTEKFASSRSTFALNATQGSQKEQASAIPRKDSQQSATSTSEAPAQVDVEADPDVSAGADTTPEHSNAPSQHSLPDNPASPPGNSSPSKSATSAHSVLPDASAHASVKLVPRSTSAARPPAAPPAPQEPSADPDLGLPPSGADALQDAVRVRRDDNQDVAPVAAATSSLGQPEKDDAVQGPATSTSTSANEKERSLSASRPSRGPGMANGRAPATVERILSAEEGSGGSAKARDRAVQMVLDTSGASWNLKRAASSGTAGGELPRKKARVEGEVRRAKSDLRSGAGARESLREQLKGFASQGTRLPVGKGVEDDDDDEEVAAAGSDDDDEDVEMEDVTSAGIGKDTGPTKHSRPKRMDEGSKTVNADVSVSVVDETMDVDATPSDAADHEVIDLTDSAPGDKSSSIVAETEHAYSAYVHPPEVIRTTSDDKLSAAFNLSRITDAWRALHTRARAAAAVPPPSTSAAALKTKAGIQDTSDDVDEVLSRVLHKKDFETMEVVGQFNLGFIIARRRTGAGGNDDLFIVDQHAADEKYNFETLQQTTKIDSQRLFRPLQLELTAADVLVATENIDILKQNGFEVIVEESEETEEYRKVKLVAQPVSKSTVFDVKDLEELLHLMQDLPAGTMVRCSKARVMFAMRACRKSIMVGDALQPKQMTKVIRNMGTMDQPWNCPHGRPTMRHLSDIAVACPKRERKVNWAGFSGYN